MAGKSRSDLKFEVIYSCHLERLMSTLLGRVDRTCSVLQLFMGTAVVTNYAPVLFGIVIALVACIQIVWQPGLKSAEAKASYDRWHTLSRNFDDLSDSEICEELHALSDRDSAVLNSLCITAHQAAALQLGLSNHQQERNKWQKFIAFIAGAHV